MSYKEIYYDLETTGLNYKKEKIIEIAAFDATNNKTFETLVNPAQIIPDSSIKICNITNEMVKDAPTLKEAMENFISFCDGNCILIAHNNDNFDKLFLQEECKNNNIEFPQWNYVDSLKWARKYRYDLPRHSLQYLREVYHIPPNQSHRALNDVKILYQVFKNMTGDLSIMDVLKLLPV